MWLPLIAFPLVLSVAVNAVASNVFTNPPDGATKLSYQEGTILEITWVSDLQTVALTLWPTTNANESFEYLPKSGNISNTGTYPWLVQTNYDITNTSFWFIIYDPGSTTPSLRSSVFNITAASSSAVSSSTTATATIATATTASKTFSSESTPTQSANSTQPAVVDSGLTSGAKTGIGIGVTLCVLLLIALGIFAGWRLSRSRLTGQSSGAYSAVGSNRSRGYTATETPLEYRYKSQPKAPLEREQELRDLPPQEGEIERLELEHPPQEIGNGLPVELPET